MCVCACVYENETKQNIGMRLRGDDAEEVVCCVCLCVCVCVCVCVELCVCVCACVSAEVAYLDSIVFSRNTDILETGTIFAIPDRHSTSERERERERERD